MAIGSSLCVIGRDHVKTLAETPKMMFLSKKIK